MAQSDDQKAVDERTANRLEEEYVHKVYESIADHFSQTRHKPWPKVANFLNALPVGSLVLDIGCGNGKYLNVNPNVFMVGSDRSQQLLQICRHKNSEAVLADCLQLSFRHCLDACICVAVLHHLSSDGRRLQALQSMVDSLTIGGKALVYVWALDQRTDGRKSGQYVKKDFNVHNDRSVAIDDNLTLSVHQNGTQFRTQELLVPWKTSRGEDNDQRLRYYHVFRTGELEELVTRLPNGRLLDIYYDCGNWAAIIQRI